MSQKKENLKVVFITFVQTTQTSEKKIFKRKQRKQMLLKFYFYSAIFMKETSLRRTQNAQHFIER